MYIYTLGFIKRKDELLLVNREKNPWKGCWNGVGGKIEQGETLVDSMIREIYEETNILVSKEQMIDKGYLTWDEFEADGHGLHIFLINLDDHYNYPTPQKVTEGILDWKKIDWAIDKKNVGVAHNIPYFLPNVLNNEFRYHYHCTFKDDILKSVTKEKIK